MSKYGNKKAIIDGITFDSRNESDRYVYLKLLEMSGEIQNLKLQKEFELIPAQFEYIPRYNKSGKRLKDEKVCIEKKCVYKADFVYIQDGEVIVEDVKGFKTKDYVIKRKLMLKVHGIRVREV